MSKSFKRRPKGSGSTYKLKGNRRKPYVAAVTLGADEETGRQIQKPIGYFASEIEALNALADYHKNPDEFNTSIKSITVDEIWNIVVEKELVSLSKSTMQAYKVAYKKISQIHNEEIKKLKLFDLQPIFDKMSNEGIKHSMMNTTKVILSKIYNYAMRYEYVIKDYSNLIRVVSLVESKSKIPFSETQIKWLFEHDDNITVQSILIMIYTGIRPGEMLEMKKDNIHLNDRYMIGGLKTKAGINRTIPIHECLVKYIDNLMKNDSQYLFAPKNKGISSNNYLVGYFNKLKKLNNWSTSPHSCRHTFITLANKYDIKDINIKKIVGHANNDITKDIYTHIAHDILIKEVNKIPKIC